MKFGPVPVGVATGAILAHSITLGTTRLRKGEQLTKEQCAALLAGGYQFVVVATRDADDVHEDEAALRIATLLCGNNLRLGAAATGRTNIYACADGVVSFDAENIDTLNNIDESITCACILPYSRVSTGQLVATVKIIPFAVAQKYMSQLSISHPIQLHPFHPVPVQLIQTTLPHLKPSLYEKAEAVTRERICHSHGGALVTVPHVPHAVDALATALARPHDGPTLIMGASATVDRGDVIPAAIVKAGGDIIRFGLPVDPGNLLCIGRLHNQIIIGLPGCARSPKLNGFDWILDRLFAGLPLTSDLCAAMGVGGLLDETPERPSPRRLADRIPAEKPQIIGAVLLAAGTSKRMGSVNKLLLDDGKGALVLQTAQSLTASGLADTLVVLGHDADRIAEVLKPLGHPMLYNPHHLSGMASSIRAGLALAPVEWDGAFVALGDMPYVKPSTLTAMIKAFKPELGHDVVVPTCNGKRGNPVLWGRRHWTKFLDISGDMGGKFLLDAIENSCVEIDVADPAIHTDIDTPKAWAERPGNT